MEARFCQCMRSCTFGSDRLEIFKSQLLICYEHSFLWLTDFLMPLRRFRVALPALWLVCIFMFVDLLSVREDSKVRHERVFSRVLSHLFLLLFLIIFDTLRTNAERRMQEASQSSCETSCIIEHAATRTPQKFHWMHTAPLISMISVMVLITASTRCLWRSYANKPNNKPNAWLWSFFLCYFFSIVKV